MNYLNIVPFSTEDYEGVSVTLAVSGCIHKCPGCWNPAGWKYSSGNEFTEEVYQELKGLLVNPFVHNLCIQGGDGLAPRNVQSILDLCKRVKSEIPDKNIVLFTGYTMQEILDCQKKRKVLEYVDVVVDGRYERELPSAQYRGSSNQKIWKIKLGDFEQ